MRPIVKARSDTTEKTKHRAASNPFVIGTARYAGGVADEDDDAGFWPSVPGFREPPIEADADYAAGRTVSDDEVRAAFGLSRRERTFGRLPGLAVPDTFDEPLPNTEVTLWEDDPQP